MANYALWNVRKRHEWLAKAGKKQKLARRGRVRVGLQAALDRKADGGKESTGGLSRRGFDASALTPGHGASAQTQQSRMSALHGATVNAPRRPENGVPVC